MANNPDSNSVWRSIASSVAVFALVVATPGPSTAVIARATQADSGAAKHWSQGARTAGEDLLTVARRASVDSAKSNRDASSTDHWLAFTVASKRFDGATGVAAVVVTSDDPAILERYNQLSFEVQPARVTTSKAVESMGGSMRGAFMRVSEASTPFPAADGATAVTVAIVLTDGTRPIAKPSLTLMLDDSAETATAVVRLSDEALNLGR